MYALHKIIVQEFKWYVESKCNLYPWMAAAFILPTSTKMNKDFSEPHL